MFVIVCFRHRLYVSHHELCVRNILYVVPQLFVVVVVPQAPTHDAATRHVRAAIVTQLE